MQAGRAIKIELNKLVPTARRRGIPKVTKRGMTKIGPPAPERAHTAPVNAPSTIVKGKRCRREVLGSVDSAEGETLFFLSRIERPESKTTK